MKRVIDVLGDSKLDCFLTLLMFHLTLLRFYPILKKILNLIFSRERSGRVLDSRPRGCGIEPHRRRFIVSLSKNINPS